MSYMVLARKYRPETFDDVVGQRTVARTLRNAITMDRVPHASLFSGPRGVGKTTMARIFAKALDCEKGPTPTPCNTCELCTSIWTGDDVDVVEIDGASNNSVEDIRDLREKVQYTTARARYKIYIIDEVHMLSRPAFNALLKTLEEPPPHVKFIFATTELNRVPDTVQSRCQRFDFFPLTTAAIAGRLRMLCERENVTFEDAALEKIAEQSGGSMRDAESALDQVISLGAGAVTAADVDAVFGTVSDEQLLELADASLAGDAQRVLQAVHDVTAAGSDPSTIASQLAAFLRDILAMHACGADTALVSRAGSVRPGMAAIAGKSGKEPLLYATRLLCQAAREMTRSPHAGVLLETCLIKAGDAGSMESIAALTRRIEGLASGTAAPAPAPEVAPAPSRTPGPAPPARQAPPPPPQSRAPTRAPAPPADEPAEDAPAPPADEPAEDAPAPAPANPAAKKGTLEESWQGVLANLKEMGKQATAALLKETEPIRIQDRKLIVGVHSGFRFHKEHLEQFENRQLVEDALEAVTGTRYDLEFVSVGDTPRAEEEQTAPRQRKPTLQDDPMLKKAIEIFDAKIVSIKEM